MRAEVESFGPDAVTLSWTTPPAEPWLVHFLALGGASIRSAQVDWASSPPTADGADLVLVAPADGATIGIGAGDGRRQAAAGYSVAHGSAPGAVSGAQRRTPRSSSSVDPQVVRCYLALEGVRAKVGVDVSPTRPGSRRTRVGFRPRRCFSLVTSPPRDGREASAASASAGRPAPRAAASVGTTEQGGGGHGHSRPVLGRPRPAGGRHPHRREPRRSEADERRRRRVHAGVGPGG